MKTKESPLKAFKEPFEKESSPEGKIKLSIEWMRKILIQPEEMDLRHFWEIKRLTLPLFKEQMLPIKRNHLWASYAELTKEAQRLKKMIDEQSAFSVEQIELAINALESDFSRYDQMVEELSLIHISEPTRRTPIS